MRNELQGAAANGVEIEAGAEIRSFQNGELTTFIYTKGRRELFLYGESENGCEVIRRLVTARSFDQMFKRSARIGGLAGNNGRTRTARAK